MRGRLGLVVAVAVLGCGRFGSSASGGNAEGGAPSASVATAAPAGPCIAGKWDAKDLSAKIKTSIKSAANAGLTPVSGKITYDFSAPADGKGVVTVTVTDFVTKMAMSQSGVNINGTITLTGPAKMPYTQAGDALTIAVPTEGKINAHADVQTSGIVATRKTEDSAVDLHGSYVHECAGDTLQLWNKGGAGKTGAPLVFTRIK